MQSFVGEIKSHSKYMLSTAAGDDIATQEGGVLTV